MTTGNAFYPIGVAGQPWGTPERAQWQARQNRQRDYDEIVARIEALGDRFETIVYGQLAYDRTYPLYALRSRDFDPTLPSALITGGVHGYETSGVLGVLEFAERHAQAYAGRINLLLAPCISPWAYEHISRWNCDAVDPNRNFQPQGPVECTALMALAQRIGSYLLHIDLHETTDSDEAEFRPALSARDGKPFEPGEIPDGFYLVADSADPQLDFQSAIISAVANVTHIAEPDAQGEIIGSPIIAPGVIEYPVAELGLSTSITAARFKTTTEVYPDSPSATPEICIHAQVVAVCAALDFALAAQD